MHRRWYWKSPISRRLHRPPETNGGYSEESYIAHPYATESRRTPCSTPHVLEEATPLDWAWAHLRHTATLAPSDTGRSLPSQDRCHVADADVPGRFDEEIVP